MNANDLEKVIRDNPKAAQEIEEMKDVIGALHDLRKAGVARGSDLRPFRGRQTVNELNPKSIRRGNLKLTVRS